MLFSLQYLLAILTLLVIAEGFTKQGGQCLPCRAPEVWAGMGVSHFSDVWSLGVTVSLHIFLLV